MKKLRNVLIESKKLFDVDDILCALKQSNVFFLYNHKKIFTFNKKQLFLEI